MRDVRALENTGLRYAIYTGYLATVSGLVCSVGFQSWAWAVGWLLGVAAVVAAALAVLPNSDPDEPPPVPPPPDPGRRAAASYLTKPSNTTFLPASPPRPPHDFDD